MKEWKEVTKERRMKERGKIKQSSLMEETPLTSRKAEHSLIPYWEKWKWRKDDLFSLIEHTKYISVYIQESNELPTN